MTDRGSVQGELKIPRFIRRFSAPILMFWAALAIVFTLAVPSLEQVSTEHAVSLIPHQAPSLQAMHRVGEDFHKFSSNSTATLVLEGDQPLDATAHRYYDTLIAALQADTTHVEHIQDLWSDPFTAAAAQSSDGKAAYAQLYLAGDLGESLANESVAAVRSILDNTAAPPGITAHLTGVSAVSYDQQRAATQETWLIAAVAIGVIAILLLLIYRVITTVLLVLLMVCIELSCARGVIALLADTELIAVSPFTVHLITTLAIAAAANYAIFLLGRYHEARLRGHDSDTAFIAMFSGAAPVVLGSGLAITGATLCLSITGLPYFQALGITLAIGMFTVLAATLTLGPAMISLGSRVGLCQPRQPNSHHSTHMWRRVGTAVVRWPGPILAASLVLAVIGIIALPSYQTDYNDLNYLPDDIPANQGFAAASRHHLDTRMNPELLLLETDQDVRNSADMLILDRIAKNIFHTPGIARVQSITRPLGTPIEHTSIPFILSMQSTTQIMNMSYLQDRMHDMVQMGEEMQKTITTMEQMYALTQELTTVTHSMVAKTEQMLEDTREIRDHIADFDDFFRPIRNYFYWEPHCFTIPICWSLRSVFDTIDGVDILSDDLEQLTIEITKLDTLMPRLAELMPPMIATMTTMRTTILTMKSTMGGMQDQMEAMQDNATVMGQAFDAAHNDDSFYLPPEIFDNPVFQHGLEMFISPNGKAVQLIISHENNPASPEGIAQVDSIKNATFEALKGTPLEGSRVYIGGTASMYKDMRHAANNGLLITGIAALCLIFSIMLIVTRSIVASGIIIGTAALSLTAAFGFSVLLWQHLIGLPLHWMVIATSFIILLAVGAGYNLLLVARLKEEIYAGLNTGIIRAMAGSGSVITAAGVVFAATMASLLISNLTVASQIGTTLAFGVLFDALVVRAVMTPAIAALLGQWFWWPQHLRQRPIPTPWPQLPATTSSSSPPSSTSSQPNGGSL